MNSYEKKLEYLDWELGVFFHFGIRSFYPGHVDWDGKEMPMEAFNPTELDCESWIRTIKAAGAKYAVMTSKHHDGFALWPTKYSEYSVAGTPWKDGKGDVVREFVDACRKEDIKVGLYYSPAQWGKYAVCFENEAEYDEYFINQLSELLTGYGKIDYLWLDAEGSAGHKYDSERILKVISELQPDMLYFGGWNPGVRWHGNDDGYASLNNPLVVHKEDYSILATEEEKRTLGEFLPGECDTRIRHEWFYDNNEETLKSTDELFGMYEMSVGHGSNLLVNIGPDHRGLLPDADARRFLALGERIRNTYGRPLDFTAPEKDGDTYTIAHKGVSDPDWYMPYEDRLSNAVVIREDLTDGQKITSFSVYAYLPRNQQRKILVFEGKTVGHKVFCKFGAIRATKYEVVVNSSDGEHKIKDIKAVYVK